MNKRGFLLVDSLINVFIVCCLSLLCFAIYKAYNSYTSGYENYQEEMSIFYEDTYNSLGVCEKCIIQEEDLSPLE